MSKIFVEFSTFVSIYAFLGCMVKLGMFDFGYCFIFISRVGP